MTPIFIFIKYLFDLILIYCNFSIGCYSIYWYHWYYSLEMICNMEIELDYKKQTPNFHLNWKIWALWTDNVRLIWCEIHDKGVIKSEQKYSFCGCNENPSIVTFATMFHQRKSIDRYSICRLFENNGEFYHRHWVRAHVFPSAMYENRQNTEDL